MILVFAAFATFQFQIVGGTCDRIGEAFQRYIQIAWDRKTALIAVEHKRDGHKLWCMPLTASVPKGFFLHEPTESVLAIFGTGP